MKGPSFRFLIPLLAAAALLSLGGCRLLHKKAAAPVADAPKPEEKKEGAPSATTEGEPAGTPATQKTGEQPEQKKEAAAKPEPEQPAADPLKAEEFKNLPKGEAEFILACRTTGTSDKATVAGRDGLIFSTAELRALGTNPATASAHHQAVVAGIAAYSAKLKAAGIEFVVAPVPPKPVVYPDYVSAGTKLKDRRYDSNHQRLYDDLDKAGVLVVDLTKALRSNRFDRQGGSFPRAGTLWSPRAAAETAGAIFKSVKRTDAAKTIVRDKTIVSKKIGVAQDGEVFAAESVGRLEGDRIVAAAVAKEGAPIVVIGDANAAAFRQVGQSASLGDQLSLAFGAPVETRSESSLGWKEAAGKFSPKKENPTRVVVWSFSAADFLGKPAAPANPGHKPARRGSSGPASPPRALDGPSLKLRDDPGLDVRPQ